MKKLTKMHWLESHAWMVEPVDTRDLKSLSFGSEGSSPSLGTIKQLLPLQQLELEREPACQQTGPVPSRNRGSSSLGSTIFSFHFSLPSHFQALKKIKI